MAKTTVSGQCETTFLKKGLCTAEKLYVMEQQAETSFLRRGQCLIKDIDGDDYVHLARKLQAPVILASPVRHPPRVLHSSCKQNSVRGKYNVNKLHQSSYLPQSLVNNNGTIWYFNIIAKDMIGEFSFTESRAIIGVSLSNRCRNVVIRQRTKVIDIA